MKKQGLIITLAAAVLLLAVPDVTVAQGRGSCLGCCTATPSQPLTADEINWLRFMREEEKLARDVYELLESKWNLTVFRNIAASEQMHFDAVGMLLSCYKIDDPAKSTAPGVFADAKLAALYNQLAAQGTKSVKDALEVGVVIEKTDIEDLETALKATARADIKRVYTNLLNASFNHLEAFETNLEIACAR